MGGAEEEDDDCLHQNLCDFSFFFIFYIALLLLPCLSYQKQLLKYLLLRYSMELFWEGREHREHEEKE